VKTILRTSAGGGAIECKTIASSPGGQVVIRRPQQKTARPSRREGRCYTAGNEEHPPPPPQSIGIILRAHTDPKATKEIRRPHVERVTPAAHARRKFAPPYWTTARGASDAPNSNAAPDRSIRKTPCRARAYHAAAGRTTISRGEGEMEKNRKRIGYGEQGCR
jgi:hypothetical protein